ncbi:MAG: PhzF family phenazine biosynthesis protein [Ignavibacteriaceae bacterium]
MAKKINIFQIDAFTDKPFKGNQAAVCFADELTSKEKQVIANEMNLAETAFISKSKEADYNLKWFTPTTEVELCGHGTIASLHFLKEKNKIKENSQITFETLSGILKCKYENGKYFMQIPIFKMEEFIGDKQEVLNALKINPKKENGIIPFILLENKNLYIYVKTLETLKSIFPDFNELVRITKEKKEFSGIAVFTLETVDKKNSAHLRYFAPYYGIDEDIVTGSANGPLLLVLKKLGLIEDKTEEISLTFEQGDFKNRPGRVGATYSESSNELYISGKAVTVLKGDLFF